MEAMGYIFLATINGLLMTYGWKLKKSHLQEQKQTTSWGVTCKQYLIVIIMVLSTIGDFEALGCTIQSVVVTLSGGLSLLGTLCLTMTVKDGKKTTTMHHALNSTKGILMVTLLLMYSFALSVPKMPYVNVLPNGPRIFYSLLLLHSIGMAICTALCCLPSMSQRSYINEGKAFCQSAIAGTLSALLLTLGKPIGILWMSDRFTGPEDALASPGYYYIFLFGLQWISLCSALQTGRFTIVLASYHLYRIVFGVLGGVLVYNETTSIVAGQSFTGFVSLLGLVYALYSLLHAEMETLPRKVIPPPKEPQLLLNTEEYRIETPYYQPPAFLQTI